MQRDNYIDFLRALGLLLVILAHVNAPDTLTQIRSFDVPLMVFVSGLSYSNKVVHFSWGGFFSKRVLRLVFPVFIFLSFFFTANFIVGRQYSLSKVLYSYLLCVEGSIGYVWIIKVFLIIMLMTPLLSYISESFSSVLVWLIVFVCFVAQELLSVLLIDSSLFIKETLLYIFGYSAVFLIGLQVKKLKTRGVLFVALLFTVLVLFCFIYYKTFGLEVSLSPYYKYPPRFYFLSYGVAVCSFLWLSKPFLSGISNYSFILFIGRNTIWIYLWHIPFVMLMLNISSSWVIRYIVVLVGSLSLFYLQYIIVNRIQLKHSELSLLKYFKG